MRPRSLALRLSAAALVGLLLGTTPEASTQTVEEIPFGVLFDARLTPTTRSASVRIRVRQDAPLLQSLRLRIDPERHREFSGDGEIEQGPDWVEWRPPASGGSLRYVFRIDQLRDARSYDARCSEDWAIFRGDDLVPPARTVVEDGARSRSRLRLRLPEGWSAATPYPRDESGVFQVEHPDRLFDRPTGWIVAGRRMGILRERVAGVRVTIAGPAGQGLRRLDMLSMLRWSLPSLREAFGALPERLLVASAGDPMWRGGLSGPDSLFIHADRPLITPDATSPMLHEVVHVALPLRAAPGADWIVEGLAELYSLEALVRSGTLSRRRYERALEHMAEKGRSARDLTADEASGRVTGRAVAVLHELDKEIRRESGDARGLDDVVRALSAEGGQVDARRLREAAEAVAGTDLAGFFRRLGVPRGPSRKGGLPPMDRPADQPPAISESGTTRQIGSG